MTEYSKLPFFINTKRLERAESYFDIGRNQDKLRQFLEQKRSLSNAAFRLEAGEDYGLVNRYGIARYISLDSGGVEGGGLDENDSEKTDEDVQHHNTSMFSLFWMTLKSFATCIGDHFSRSNYIPRKSDSESNPNERSKIVGQNCNDPRIKEDDSPEKLVRCTQIDEVHAKHPK